jgi:hypothetical protein
MVLVRALVWLAAPFPAVAPLVAVALVAAALALAALGATLRKVRVSHDDLPRVSRTVLDVSTIYR